jgi:hypothetical protein
MLDTFSKKANISSMLVDQQTFGILTVSVSPAVINALAEGIPNSSLMVAQLPGKHNEIIRNYNRSSTNNYILTTSGSEKGYAIPSAELSVAKVVPEQEIIFDIEKMDNVTEQFNVSRQLANRRQHVLASIETKLERYAGRVVHSTVDDVFIPYMTTEIDKCIPENNYYTPGLEAWAISAGLPVKQAYQECKMVVSSTNITIMRLHAYWKWFISHVNSLDFSDQSLMQETIALAEFKLRSGM